MNKSVNLPDNVVGVIRFNHWHETAYLFYEIGTMNFYFRYYKNKKYYKCKYYPFNSSLCIRYYDTHGNKQLNNIKEYFHLLNKQMNGELYKQYPYLDLRCRSNKCNCECNNNTLTFIVFSSKDNSIIYKTTQILEN